MMSGFSARISSLNRCFFVFLGICLVLTLVQLLILTKHGEYINGLDNKNTRIMMSRKSKLIEVNPHPENSHTKSPNNIRSDTLLDLKGFEFLSHNENLCRVNGTDNNGMDKLLLILIHSSPTSVEFRNLIRKTWGSLSVIGGWNVRFGFLLGKYSISPSKTSTTPTSPDLNNFVDVEKIQNEIYEESAKEQDLIIGNFMDTYKNLGYKQIMGYKWALKFCPEATFVLKTDTDVFVDVFQLVNALRPANTKNTIVCEANHRMVPQRDPANKWFVSMKDFRSKTFPTYCPGMGYLLSSDLLHDFIKASERAKYFWIEDVYVTGMLRVFARDHFGTKVHFVNLGQKYTFNDEEAFTTWLYENNCERELPWIFIHCVGADITVNFEQLWKLAMKLNTKQLQIKEPNALLVQS